jgi:hypothetical protein
VREDPEAVVLDLVNPSRTVRRRIGQPRQAWFEPRKGMLGAYPAPEFTHY